MGETIRNISPAFIKALPATMNARSQHILLVDGNEKQRSIFASLLTKNLQYRLSEVPSGEEAIRFCRQKPVDLVLMDLSTLDDGFQSIVELCGAYPDVPIVVIVKYDDYQEAAEALLVGAHDFLTKPVAEERMSVTLRNALQLRQIRREMHKASRAAEGGGQRFPAEGETVISLVNAAGDTRKMDEIEQAAIRFAVRFYNGRMTEVARKLGIGRSALYRKLGNFEGA